MKKLNWKTTTFGGIAAAGTGLVNTGSVPDEWKGTIALVATISGLLAAFFTRDKDVTSEGTAAPK